MMNKENSKRNVREIVCSDANIHDLYKRQRLIMIRYEQDAWCARWFPCAPKGFESHNWDKDVITCQLSLREAFEEAYEHRLEAAAILLYDMKDYFAHGKDPITFVKNKPFVAIEQDGTVKGFTEGYYLSDIDDFISYTLMEYAEEYSKEPSDKYRLYPEIDINGDDITEGTELSLPKKYSYFVKAAGYYEINTEDMTIVKNKVHGLANGYLYTGFRDAVMDVMGDKAKEENDYPIIILSKNREYVILDNGEVMQITKGFISRYNNITANEAFEIFFNCQVENALNA